MLAFLVYRGAFDHYIHTNGVFSVVLAALAIDALIHPEPALRDARVGERARIDWQAASVPVEPAADRRS